jgi:peptide deformylase
MIRQCLKRLGPSVIRQRGDPALERVCPPVSADILYNPDERCITQFPQIMPPPDAVPLGNGTSLSQSASKLVSLNEMVEDLHEALRQFKADTGFGRAIAAPQLGYFARVVAVQINNMDKNTLVNPYFTKKSNKSFTMWDDCFSFPGQMVRVKRFTGGNVKYLSRKGDIIEWLDVDKGTCELLQHEFDHLDGILSHHRAAPVVVPKGSPLMDLPLDYAADGTIFEVPRELYLAHKKDFAKLVSPHLNE